MKEEFELVEHIYKDASMAVHSITKLLDTLKDKDNKIKGDVEDLLQEYESYEGKAKEELVVHDIEPMDEGAITKMMASMGIAKEVKSDNSDSAIAELLIQGISMGSLEMEKKIKDYEDRVDKHHVKFAKEFLKFQQKAIDDLKDYL